MSLNTILATAPLTATGYHLKATGTALGQSLIWDNGTNVGISTVSPVTTNLVGSMTIVKSYNSDTPVSTTAQTYYTNQSNLYLFGRNAGLSIITNSTNEEGTIFFGNASTVAYASINTGSGTTSVGGDMNFKVGSNTERMRITSAGNVGIGNTTALHKLQIGANADTKTSIGQSILFLSANAGNIGYVNELGFGDVSSTFPQSAIGNIITNATAASFGDLYFATRNVTTDTAPTERMRITSGGNVSIGSTVDAGFRLFVKHPTGGIYVEAGTTSAHKALQCNTDSTGTILFFVRGDGLINTGLASFSPYNFSLTGRDCYINSSGELGYLSSTRESKTNISSVSDINWVSQLNAVSFNYRKKDDEMNYTEEFYDDKSFGFIADEVEKVNPDFVFYDINEDGSKKLAGVKYQSMTAILTKIVQEQQIQIQNLQAQINILAK